MLTHDGGGGGVEVGDHGEHRGHVHLGHVVDVLKSRIRVDDIAQNVGVGLRFTAEDSVIAS